MSSEVVRNDFGAISGQLRYHKTLGGANKALGGLILGSLIIGGALEASNHGSLTHLNPIMDPIMDFIEFLAGPFAQQNILYLSYMGKLETC